MRHLVTYTAGPTGYTHSLTVTDNTFSYWLAGCPVCSLLAVHCCAALWSTSSHRNHVHTVLKDEGDQFRPSPFPLLSPSWRERRQRERGEGKGREESLTFPALPFPFFPPIPFPLLPFPRLPLLFSLPIPSGVYPQYPWRHSPSFPSPVFFSSLSSSSLPSIFLSAKFYSATRPKWLVSFWGGPFWGSKSRGGRVSLSSPVVAPLRGIMLTTFRLSPT